jgi:hypothetical protein
MALLQSIQRNMELVGCDGAHVGTVARLGGTDEIKLAKDDPDGGGEEHYIPRVWLVHAEIKVHLKQYGDEAEVRLNTH